MTNKIFKSHPSFNCNLGNCFGASDCIETNTTLITDNVELHHLITDVTETKHGTRYSLKGTDPKKVFTDEELEKLFPHEVLEFLWEEVI